MKTLFLVLASCAAFVAVSFGGPKRVLLVAGPPSHPPGFHEHNAGVLLLQQCLASVPGVSVDVSLNGFPKDLKRVEQADSVLIFSDGGEGHVGLHAGNFEALKSAMKRGAGLLLLHYALIPAKETGYSEFMQWAGGLYEPFWSVNPFWVAEFAKLPDHPVTRGVKPFQIHDEWYFHMRFAPDARGLTPLLVATPPPSTMERPDGEHSGNPHVRAAVARREPQTLAWAFERPDGGRGFGFTGGHDHKNWGHDDFRKLVLNAIVWTAKAEVPAGGVASKVTPADLEKNHDVKR